jgi:hypothetical protein
MQANELSQLMQESAASAVTITREEFEIELDGSLESLSNLDKVIMLWLEKYKSQALEDKAVFTLCNTYGAYVGEIFISLVGGNWRYDNSDPDSPYIAVDYLGKSYVFPSIIYQRLVNDDSVSIRAYFEQAVSNNSQ